MTMLKVSGSAILANEEMLAVNDDMWACASERWSKHNTMDLHLLYLFRQLPEEGPSLRDVCHWLCHVDTFSGEVLPQMDTVAVMNGSEDHIDISFSHLSPVLHHQFLE